MYGYVYLTTNLINGKKYIGQHKGVFNPTYIGTGISIVQAIKKYGKINFKCEPLVYCETKEELDIMEERIIDAMNAVNSNLFYNQVRGGRGGILYERRDKENNPFFGKSQTEKQKAAARLAQTGRIKSSKEIEKIKDANKGKILSDEMRRKLGKKQTVLDTVTNIVYEFNSVKEAYKFCGCGDKTYHTMRKENKLIKGRYKVIQEEDKYGRN